MKKDLIFKLNLVLLFAIALFAQSFAQLSEGGTPPGFKFAPDSRLTPVEMPAINTDSLLQDDAINEQYTAKPYRFGYNHFVNYDYNNSGVWTTLPNGDRVWQIDILARGAYSINLAFSNFVLPPGARLFVYSKDHKQILGGFSSKNNNPDNHFGTELIHADEVVVEYYEPAQVRGRGSFILFRVTQGYKSLQNYLKSFGQAGSCINNINCPQYAAFAVQKQAVVCIVVNGGELCSGALVNNTRNDGTPYILTANHCDAANDATSWVFRFNWEAPGCADPATDPSTAQSISGCSVMANSNVSDFFLVKMSTAPPASYQPFYLGWNYGKTPATNVTCIHHPNGDIKKCSRADNPVTATAYDAGNGTAQVWQIGQWTDGVTEPGSSGSPLLDENKREVGQLYGGTSDCNQPDSLQRDYYGRFDVSWDSLGTPQTRLRDWLDPDSTNPVTNDGYMPYPPQSSLDAALNAIVSPTGVTCNSITPVLAIENNGSDTIYALTIIYNVDGGGDSVYNWAGSLVPLQSATINLPAVAVPQGTHIFYANVTQPNNSADQNPANDTASISFFISNPATVPAPLVEGFESGVFPPTGWTITTPPSGTTWQADSVGGYGLSNTSAAVDEFSPTGSTVGEKPGLITPVINMAGLDTPLIMFFDVANARFSPAYYDSLAVLASTDCGATWARIYAKGGPSLATAPDDSFAFVPTASQWRTDTIDINEYAGTGAVEFQFQLISGYGNITYVDNINIGQTLAGIKLQPGDISSVNIFPNPFADAFTVRFNLPQEMNLSAGLYAMDGRLVAPILNNEKLQAGVQQFNVNTENLSNGLYILRLNNQYLKLEKLK